MRDTSRQNNVINPELGGKDKCCLQLFSKDGEPTGLSSSAEFIGELDCMMGATSLIDMVSLPETAPDFVCPPKNSFRVLVLISE
jgi:hypothetical protein